MDAGIGVRSVGSVASAHATPSIPVVPAAPTTLPQQKTVTPVAHGAPAHTDVKPAQQQVQQDSTTRDAIIDPQTSEVVHRVLDARTRQVVDQEPDQALLRMQAYARAQALKEIADGQKNAGADPIITHVDALT